MATGGIVDDAADVIPVNLLNARLTPGPIEWDAWASLSLDTWGVSEGNHLIYPFFPGRGQEKVYIPPRFWTVSDS